VSCPPCLCWSCSITVLIPLTGYQFNICDSNKTSPIGRTKTIPRKKDKTHTPIKFAIYSCSNYRKSERSNSIDGSLRLYLYPCSLRLLQRLR
jgi:phosphodiesterase/alkaline phosphatase D-like protein